MRLAAAAPAVSRPASCRRNVPGTEASSRVVPSLVVARQQLAEAAYGDPAATGSMRT